MVTFGRGTCLLLAAHLAPPLIYICLSTVELLVQFTSRAGVTFSAKKHAPHAHIHSEVGRQAVGAAGSRGPEVGGAWHTGAKHGILEVGWWGCHIILSPSTVSRVP